MNNYEYTLNIDDNLKLVFTTFIIIWGLIKLIPALIIIIREWRLEKYKYKNNVENEREALKVAKNEYENKKRNIANKDISNDEQ